MSLARPVEESLRASQEHLRDALAFAARGEKPYVSKHIADFLADIDTLIDAHEVIERINEFSKKEDEKWVLQKKLKVNKKNVFG